MTTPTKPSKPSKLFSITFHVCVEASSEAEAKAKVVRKMHARGAKAELMAHVIEEPKPLREDACRHGIPDGSYCYWC